MMMGQTRSGLRRHIVNQRLLFTVAPGSRPVMALCGVALWRLWTDAERVSEFGRPSRIIIRKLTTEGVCKACRKRNERAASR